MHHLHLQAGAALTDVHGDFLRAEAALRAVCVKQRGDTQGDLDNIKRDVF